MSALTKEFVIVGGGANGAAIALMLTRKLKEQREERIKQGTSPDDLPRALVTIVDPKDYTGAGVTFWDNQMTRDDEDVMWNNQPNERMILDPVDPLAYTRWLNEKNPSTVASTAKTFSSRIKFGSFSHESIRKRIEETRFQDISMHCLRGLAHSVTVKNNEALTLKTTSSRPEIDETVVIAAVGHDINPDFEEFTSLYDNVFRSPLAIEQFHEFLGTLPENATIAIRGAGQSMIDVMAAYDRNRYMRSHTDTRAEDIGTIRVERTGPNNIARISRTTVADLREQHLLPDTPHFKVFSSEGESLHWPFFPEQHPPKLDDIAYEAQILTPEYITSSGAPKTFESLKKLLEEEIRAGQQTLHVINGKERGFGMGQILGKINLEPLTEIFTSEEEEKALEKFTAYINKLYSSPTPVERDRLLQSMFARQAEHVKGHINPDNIERLENGKFRITTEDGYHDVDAIIDSVTFARNAYSDIGDPSSVRNLFMRTLNEQGLLKLNEEKPGLFVAGQQSHPALYIAAGPNTQEKWGIESFARANDRITDEIIERHFAI